MTGAARRMAVIWIAAGLGVTALFSGLLFFPGSDIAKSRTARTVEMLRGLDPMPSDIVVGSSMAQRAFPPYPNLAAVGQPPRRGLRLAMSCVEPEDIYQLVDAAIELGAERIFVGVNHLFYGIAPCEKIIGDTQGFAGFGPRLRSRIKWLVRGASWVRATMAHESPWLDRTFKGERAMMEKEAPPDFRASDPTPHLAKLLEKARRNGTDVHLFAVPRSESWLRYIGVRQEIDFAARLEALSLAVGKPVWRVAVSWPDHLFADPGHVNRTGRTRFMDALREMLNGVS